MRKETKKAFFDLALLPAVLSLAWPTMLEQLMQTAVQYIDTAMVGSLGTAATAAVGSTVTVNWLIGSSISAFGVGFLSYVSQAIGARETERARRAAAQSVLMVLAAGVYILCWKGGGSFRFKRLLLHPDFGADAGKELSISADTMLEVVGMSRLAGLFCRENGIDERKANVLALCIEELGGNIIAHGFSDGKPHSIDMRILAKDGELILRIRDDCRPFNLMERYRMTTMQAEDPTKNIGIRMVVKMSRDVRYLSTLETNNLIIRI